MKIVSLFPVTIGTAFLLAAWSRPAMLFGIGVDNTGSKVAAEPASPGDSNNTATTATIVNGDVGLLSDSGLTKDPSDPTFDDAGTGQRRNLRYREETMENARKKTLEEEPTSGPTAGHTSGPASGPTSGPTSRPTAGPISGPTSERHTKIDIDKFYELKYIFKYGQRHEKIHAYVELMARTHPVLLDTLETFYALFNDYFALADAITLTMDADHGAVQEEADADIAEKWEAWKVSCRERDAARDQLLASETAEEDAAAALRRAASASAWIDAKDAHTDYKTAIRNYQATNSNYIAASAAFHSAMDYRDFVSLKIAEKVEKLLDDSIG